MKGLNKLSSVFFIGVSILFLSISHQICAQSNVLSDIRQYKEWISANYPHPEDLSEGELFYEAAKAVYFSQREPEVIRLLEYVDENLLKDGEEQDNDLRNYIEWIKTRSNESFLKYESPALRAIAFGAKKYLGEEDINSVRCQYFYLYSDDSLRDVTSEFENLIRIQEKVVRNKNSLESKELLCLLKFGRALVEPYIDNPLNYDGIFSASALLDDLYKKDSDNYDTFEKALLYNNAANAIYNIFQENELFWVSQKYPDPEGNVHGLEPNGAHAKGRYYQKIAVETVLRLFPKCHPISIGFVGDYNDMIRMSRYANLSNLETAQYIYDFKSYYYPYDSLEQYLSLINLWNMKSRLNAPIEDAFKIPIVKREILKKGSLSEMLLINVYSCLLRLSALYDRTSFSGIKEELYQFINERFADRSMLRDYLIYSNFVNFNDVDNQIYESYVLPAIGEYKDNKESTILSIIWGRLIVNLVTNNFSDYKLGYQFQNKVCAQTRAIYGEKSMIYFDEETRRMQLLGHTNSETIRNEYEILIKKIRKNNLNPISALNNYAQFLYDGCADYENAIKIYEDLIQTCDTKHGDVFSNSLKAHFHLSYLSLLSDMNYDFTYTENIFNKAKTLLENEKDSTTIYIPNYYMASTYLAKTGRHNDALKYLNEGIRLNDRYYNGVLDIQSLLLYERKIEFLSYLNKLDEAQTLTNYLISYLDSDRLPFNAETLSILMEIYWAKPFGSNSILRLGMLSRMYEIASRLHSRTTDPMSFEMTYIIPIATEFIKWACDQHVGELDNHVNELKLNHPDLYQQNKEIIDATRSGLDYIDSIILDSSFTPEEWLHNEDLPPLIKKNIQDFIYSLSLYFDQINDKERVLHYLGEYAKSVKDSPLLYAFVLSELVVLQIQYGNSDEGEGYFNEMIGILKDLPELSGRDKFEFNNRIGTYLLEKKDYESFLPIAREQYSILKELYGGNYHLLSEDTQNEMVAIYGYPSVPFRAIFHVMPQELSCEMYDATLYDTGMQLRSLKAIKEAALKTNNPQIINLLDSIDYLRGKYKESHRDLGDMGNLDFIKDKQKLYAQIQKLEKEFINEAKAYLGDVGNDIHWQDVRNALRSDDVAIEYVFSADRIMALILKQDCISPIAIEVCSSKDLYEALQLVKGSSDERAKSIYADKVVDLYKFLWEPMTPYLNEVRNIYFTMPGVLSNFSMSAISDENGEYLVDKYHLYQVTSTSELVRSRKMAPITSDTSALILGGVFYTPDQEEDYVGPDIFKSILSGGSDIRALKEKRGIGTETFSYLPFTEFEISEIESSFSKITDDKLVRNVSGFEANEAKVRTALNEKPSIIHMATHGFFIPTEEEAFKIPFFLSRYGYSRISSMERAGLALYAAEKAWNSDVDKDNRDDGNDGILTAHEISQLDLRGVDLAVLSACESSLGNYSEEGVFGLTRGFKQAGVKSLIVSLWNVNDMSTAMLMSGFYKNLANGLSYMTAWKNAINTVRQKFPDPVYWGAFTMLDCLE